MTWCTESLANPPHLCQCPGYNKNTLSHFNYCMLLICTFTVCLINVPCTCPPSQTSLGCIIRILYSFLLMKIKLLKVWHGYLFRNMKAFGLGSGFRSLFSGASVMVNVGGGLSRPVPVRRGIRQVCPLSSQLYCLAI